MQLPEFDFSTYNPRDPWNFPPARLVRFAAEASLVVRPLRNKWALRTPYPDLRFAVFQEIHGALHALHALSCMVEGSVMDADWWSNQPTLGKTPATETMQSNHQTIREFLLAGLLAHWLSSVDSCFRQILKALQIESETTRGMGNRRATRTLLKSLGMEDREPVITLLRILLSSTQSGGKFCPENGKDLLVTYKGRSFQFKNLQPVEGHDHGFIDTWDWLLFLLRELTEMLNTLFESPQIVQVRILKARYLD